MQESTVFIDNEFLYRTGGFSQVNFFYGTARFTWQEFPTVRKAWVKQLRVHKRFSAKLCELKINSAVGLLDIGMGWESSSTEEWRGKRRHAAIQTCLWGESCSLVIPGGMTTQKICDNQNFIATWTLCRSGCFTKLVSKTLCRSGQPTRRVMLI